MSHPYRDRQGAAQPHARGQHPLAHAGGTDKIDGTNAALDQLVYELYNLMTYEADRR